MNYKVLIAVPAHSTVQTQFAYSLQALVQQSTLSGVLVDTRFEIGTLVSSAREHLINIFLNNSDYTHILWLDSDMCFPAHTLDRLLTWNLPVISCCYSTRTEPQSSVGFVVDSPNSFSRLYPSTNFIDTVDAIGMGCMLVRRDALENTAPPYFPITYIPGPNPTYQGEDINFCLQLTNSGINICVDVELSKEIQHIGQKLYEWTQQ